MKSGNKIAHSLSKGRNSSKFKAGLEAVALKCSLHFPFHNPDVLSTFFCADYADSQLEEPLQFYSYCASIPTVERLFWCEKNGLVQTPLPNGRRLVPELPLLPALRLLLAA